MGPHPQRWHRPDTLFEVAPGVSGLGTAHPQREARGEDEGPWRAGQALRRAPTPPALAHYTMATASISIIQSGWARAGMATSVEAGPFLPKNSSRTGTRSAR